MNARLKQIIELDQLNMTLILEKVGVHFDPEIRRASIEYETQKGAVFVVIECEGNITGYVEYLPESNGDIYIKSLQVHPKYQGRSIIRRLLAEVHSKIDGATSVTIKSSAHKINLASVALHRGLGFKQVDQNEERVWFEIESIDLAKRLKSFVR